MYICNTIIDTIILNNCTNDAYYYGIHLSGNEPFEAWERFSDGGGGGGAGYSSAE
jgi:hypothetical protein